MRSIGAILGVALAGALVLPASGQPAAPPPPAAAQPPAPPLTVTPPNPDMMARRMARRAARVDQDIQTLHAGLQLTPAQDSLWPAVAAAIREVDAARGFRFRQQMAAAPSSIDGLKLQGAHMAAMGAAIGKLADATGPLVATLTPDQKSRLPGLLQGVRLPKVMSRALALPQDTAAGAGSQGDPDRGGAGPDRAPARSWGIGPQGGAGTGGASLGAGQGATPAQPDDDEE